MVQKARNNQPDAWDALCRRCGRCCYEKVELEGKVYYTDVPCEHLDLKSRQCLVYENRTEARPGCVRLTDKTLRAGILPADCPYVADINDYPAPQLDPKVILP